jgi:hypothetical protein
MFKCLLAVKSIVRILNANHFIIFINILLPVWGVRFEAKISGPACNGPNRLLARR